ncbi:MAG: hypothetical protein IK137_00895 [Bacilli bacterium]|nr:hypothetical protein [Bacilli bacterium]
MKNKIIKVLLIIIGILLILFIGFKLIMLYVCTINPGDEYKEVIAGLKNQSEITISNKGLPNEEYFVVNNNFKFKNILDGYKKDNNGIYRKEINGKKYAFSFINEKEASMILTKGFSSKNEDIEFFTDSDLFTKPFYLADRKGFLEKNNIKDDYDFYKFVADNYVIKNNFFTSTKEMLQNYAFNYYCYVTIPKVAAVTYINGDLRGWVFKTLPNSDDESAYQITILKDNKQYGFYTNDSRFKDQSFMKEVISSIIIS